MYRPGGGVEPPPVGPPRSRRMGERSKSVSTGTSASTGMSGGMWGIEHQALAGRW